MIMEQVLLFVEFALLGIVGGLLGIFYRNCLKVEDMIFHWWYRILRVWVLYSEVICDEEGCHEPTLWRKFLGFIAYPLGFCIYCSTTWITFFIIALYLSTWEILPDWQMIVIGTLLSTGVQHLIVVCSCRWIISNHPDLDIR